MRGDSIGLERESACTWLRAGMQKVGKATRSVKGDAEVSGEGWT